MKPLDKNQAIRQTRRNLPHWEQAGCTYFSTWPLADSHSKAAQANEREPAQAPPPHPPEPR